MCTSCQSTKNSKSSIKGIMKKFNLKGLTNNVIPVLEGAVGFAAAKAANMLISTTATADEKKAAQNKMIVGGAQLAVGLFMLTMKSQHLKSVGMGIAIAGGHSFVAPTVDKALKAAGLAGIGYSNYPGRNMSNTAMSGIGCSNAFSH